MMNANSDKMGASRSGAPQFSSSETSPATIRPVLVNRQRGHQRNYSRPSPSPQRPAFFRAPSPPSLTESTPEIYGPDRLFGPPLIQGHGQAGRLPTQPPQAIVRFDEAQLAMFAAENSARMTSIKDDLTIAAGKITPGVDDTPYIQYALEALTRDRESATSSEVPFQFPFQPGTSTQPQARQPYQPAPPPEERPGWSVIPPPEPAYLPNDPPVEREIEQPEFFDVPETAEQAEQTQDSTPETVIHHSQPRQRERQAEDSQDEPPSTSSSNSYEGPWVPVTKEMVQYIDPRGTKYPLLDYKPAILRPFPLILLMTLCLLMIAGLAFSAAYSSQNNGLTPYPGSIYSGQYFVFRILPQILAAVILIYSQSVVVASLRILPFCALASENARVRRLALFQKMYQTSFLVPRLVGPWQFRVFSVSTWLMIFTIPLQSTAFTCIFEGDKWIWAAVQGIAWSLVILYIVQLAATGILLSFWLRRWTGLIWDVRSVGDLMPLLYQTDTLGTYYQMDRSPEKEFEFRMRPRQFDRLGYWRADDSRRHAVWYTLGEMPHDVRKASIPLDPISASHAKHRFNVDEPGIRYRYRAFALETSTVLIGIFLSAALLIAIFTVSFVKRTRLENGFLPRVPANPSKDAFSAANFLYGFVPSLIGMLLFLLFQSVDHSLRLYQPWAEMSNLLGASARRSLMADYAACLPFQSTVRAARNGHWRVAVISLMAVLFVFIPVLAGGLFMALTTTDHHQVRMLPNTPVFGVLLGFLWLYFGALCLMLCRRRHLALPHPVNTLAEVISFVTADEMVHNTAFRGVRSRADLETRLGLYRADPHEETVWWLGTKLYGKDYRLSIRPQKQYTEKQPQLKRRHMPLRSR